MLEIGRYNEMEVTRESPHGIYLIKDDQEVLLPNKYVPEEAKPGDTLRVFVYTDSEDRLVATLRDPVAVVDEFAALEVKEVVPFGAFLDWGLEKDLFVPLKEQHHKMQEGRKYVVRLCVDPRTERVIGVSKIGAFLERDTSELTEGQEVSLLVYDRTTMGYSAIIDDKYTGVIYANEVFEPLHVGDKRKGFIKKVRTDGKVDLTLRKQGFEAVLDEQGRILEALREAGGFLPYHDKSEPEVIKDVFHMSKKQFKKVIGTLYKEGKIVLNDEGITLNQ